MAVVGQAVFASSLGFAEWTLAGTDVRLKRSKRHQLSSLHGTAPFPQQARTYAHRQVRRLQCHASNESAGNKIRTGLAEGIEKERSGNGASSAEQELDCVLTGTDVECFVSETESGLPWKENPQEAIAPVLVEEVNPAATILETLLLVSPFFFWGTAMVAMKDVLPKAGPLFVAAFRLIPAGALLVAYAASRGRQMPKTAMAWLAIAVFALVDATCFQVIIDSQPLTVALLAAFFFGESIGPLGALGLVTGVLGLCLLEVPPEAIWSFLSGSELEPVGQLILSASESEAAVEALKEPLPFSLWDSGEWWMLLSAQSMGHNTHHSQLKAGSSLDSLYRVLSGVKSAISEVLGSYDIPSQVAASKARAESAPRTEDCEEADRSVEGS